MAEQRKPPHLTPSSAAAAGRRQDRLAAALRANLARRKAQSRQRGAASAPPAERPKPRG